MSTEITINGITYYVGKKYAVFSPLDSPYLFMDSDVKERRGITKNNIHNYVGILMQVPETEENGKNIKGSCLYFKVKDINYHKNFEQAESYKQIKEGIVKIKPC